MTGAPGLMERGGSLDWLTRRAWAWAAGSVALALGYAALAQLLRCPVLP